MNYPTANVTRTTFNQTPPMIQSNVSALTSYGSDSEHAPTKEKPKIQYNSVIIASSKNSFFYKWNEDKFISVIDSIIPNKHYQTKDVADFFEIETAAIRKYKKEHNKKPYLSGLKTKKCLTTGQQQFLGKDIIQLLNEMWTFKYNIGDFSSPNPQDFKSYTTKKSKHYHSEIQQGYVNINEPTSVMAMPSTTPSILSSDTLSTNSVAGDCIPIPMPNVQFVPSHRSNITPSNPSSSIVEQSIKSINDLVSINKNLQESNQTLMQKYIQLLEENAQLKVQLEKSMLTNHNEVNTYSNNQH